MACVVVESETGLLGQQYVPEAQAHRTEGAHVSVCARGMGWRDVYYMILIHIYPYVALNAACEMSRAGTGERERDRESKGASERVKENRREKREREREREGKRKDVWVEMVRRETLDCV